MLGFPILYCKGMRSMMFQLSGFCFSSSSGDQGLEVLGPHGLGSSGLGFRVCGFGGRV